MSDDPGIVSARDFGAVGDGVHDDTGALQAMLTEAWAAQRIAQLDPGRTYKANAGLHFGEGDGRIVRIEGRGGTIHGTNPGAPVISVDGNTLKARDVSLLGDSAAQHGWWLANASLSVLEHCEVYGVLGDGFHLNANTDACILYNCAARIIGRIFCSPSYVAGAPAVMLTKVLDDGDVPATLSKTGGFSPVVTVDHPEHRRADGSPLIDFVAMGVRPGGFISLHPTAPGDKASEWFQVASVDSPTQLTCCISPPSSGAASGLRFSIHVGDAYHEGPGRADNNINRLVGTFFAENVAGNGVRLNGLFGARVDDLRVNAAFAYPYSIGMSGVPTIGVKLGSAYFELCQPINNGFVGGGCGVELGTVNGTDFPLAIPGHSWGTIHNMQNATDPGRIDPLEGTSVDYVPSAVLMADVRFRGSSVHGWNDTTATPGPADVHTSWTGRAAIAANTGSVVMLHSGVGPDDDVQVTAEAPTRIAAKAGVDCFTVLADLSPVPTIYNWRVTKRRNGG